MVLYKMFEQYGFIYTDWLTKETTDKEMHNGKISWHSDMKPDKMYHVAQYSWTSLQVFINPLVASLPQHQHLFAARTLAEYG